ncbi:sulfur carrier protein ThiS [Clostridium bornimense]|uniref:sulfur carrier protein ThiS n=1 Tax=Clostridium bornimense TaxID=1216932 RepID=UPI001C1154E0|nr:sulfur carrier protein ThiS [Clostridium bornimense]MBU5315880.1 sulfur carrier protein ThiS [Clostridium bornimense]
MIINGKKYNYKDITVEELVKELDLDKDKIVVEVNLDIIPKDKFNTTTLREEDKVEIVAFIGGG